MNDWDTLYAEALACYHHDGQPNSIANVCAYLRRRARNDQWDGSAPWHLRRWAETAYERVMQVASKLEVASS